MQYITLVATVLSTNHTDEEHGWGEDMANKGDEIEISKFVSDGTIIDSSGNWWSVRDLDIRPSETIINF